MFQQILNSSTHAPFVGVLERLALGTIIPASPCPKTPVVVAPAPLSFPIMYENELAYASGDSDLDDVEAREDDVTFEFRARTVTDPTQAPQRQITGVKCNKKG